MLKSIKHIDARHGSGGSCWKFFIFFLEVYTIVEPKATYEAAPVGSNANGLSRLYTTLV